ncbi:hypothetical protein BDW67DRAFT_189140 [Aspergillus spinulosporus]
MATADQQSTQSRVHSIGPRTPPARNREPRQFVFQKHAKSRVKGPRDEVVVVDEEVRGKLTKRMVNLDRKTSHLYIFSSPEAKGFYKVGRGQDISRPTKSQERCYPNHELHCYIECPNASLFERVVHAEFLLYRRKHTCKRCKPEGREHIEWIEAPLQDILDSVTAWSMYARWFYQCGNDIDERQSLPLSGFSDRADRWRNWALEETMRWMKSSHGRMASVSRQGVQERSYEAEIAEHGWEIGSEDEYFLDSVPGLSDSPGTTPGLEEIQEPPTPATPTPASRGVADGYTRKQKNALWTPEEETNWELTTTKPTARTLFPDTGQRPSDKQRPILRAEEPAVGGTSSEKCSKNDGDRGATSSRERVDNIQGISNADIDEKVRKIIDEVVSKVQEMSTGSSQEIGTINLLSLESARGFYRVCCRKGNGTLSPSKECYDNATRFYNIPNYTEVKKLLLNKFKVAPPNRICGRCRKSHRDWIKFFEEDTTTGIELPKESVNEECPDMPGDACELPKECARKTGVDAVADMQKDNLAVEDVPIYIPPTQTPVVDSQSHNFSDGKIDNSIGQSGEMIGKPTVPTEQQAPGLLDIGIVAARGIISGLF